jgi:hypothetical protein
MAPVSISVPTRLRVDTRALRDGRHELADALAAATGRAVASSRAHLPATVPVVAPPTFDWSGDGAGDVDAATRADVEALCAEQIARAVAVLDVPVVDATATEPPAVSRSTGTPAEPAAPRTGRLPQPATAVSASPHASASSVAQPAAELGGIPLVLPTEELEDIDSLVAEALAAEQERESRQAVCEPFLDEPSIFDFGPVGHELWRRTTEIADLLETDPCPYGGAFLLTAADVLLLRVLDIGLADVVEAGTNVATGPGGADVRFRPSSSVQLEALEVLASVVPLLTALTALLEQLPDGMPPGWTPGLHELLDPRLDEVVATLFRLTCRVLFLQTLNASRIAVEARRAEPAFKQFAGLFAAVITQPRSALAELADLRDRLASDPPGGAAIVEEAGVRRIRDRQGRQWTLEELAAEITARRAAVVSPDPFVNQLALLPEVDLRFRIPDAAVPGELRRLLDELYTIVVEQTLHAQADPDLGFAWAHVVPTDGMAMVPYTIYLLRGLHLLAHELLSDELGDDLFYPRGINLLFGSELGARALAGPGELDGLVETALVAASPVELPQSLHPSSPAEPDAAGAAVETPAASPDTPARSPKPAPAEAPEPDEPAREPGPVLESAEPEPEDAPALLELTFQPDGVAGVDGGYVLVEPAAGWAPAGAESYSSPEGRRQLLVGLEARARFTLGLPGCRGWRCGSGGAKLDTIAAAALEELRSSEPELAGRIELGAGR